MNEDHPTPDPQDPKPSSFWAELKRRKVIRVAIAYAAVAWLIIQVAATTFEGFEIPLWAFRFVTLMVVLGFPVALVIAWAFELTPDGIKTTKSADAVQADKPISKTQQRKRNWMAYLIGAAVPTLIFSVLALFFFLRSDSDSTQSSSESSPPSAISDSSRRKSQEADLPSSEMDKSIAVLPLTNMSPDPDNAFFADGVQEEILTNLAKIHDLLVIGRTSTLRYRDTTKSLRDIGQELNVRYLLEGSVQRASNQVRVTVQLIETNTEGHLWAESYTRELDDFFSIISSISKEIAGQLHTVLSPEEISEIERPPTKNQEAYDLFMRGRQMGFAASAPSFQAAVDLDPDFFHGWFFLALNRIVGWRVEKNRNDPELYESAHLALSKAEPLAQGPYELGLLEAMKGVFLFNENGDVEVALKHDLEARKINPNALYNVGWRFLQLGRLAEAQYYLEAQFKRDPFTRARPTRLFNYYLYRRWWDQARQVIHRNMENYSDDPKAQLEGQRSLAIVNYLESGDMEAFHASSVVLPVIVDPQYPLGWMNDNYKIRDALIQRNLTEALDFLNDPDPYPSLAMLDGTLRKLPWGRWRLTIEPLNLLTALIHFEREDRESCMSETAKAKKHLESVIEYDAFADPNFSSLLAICYALDGNRNQVNAILSEVRERTSQVNYQFRFQAICEVHFAMAYLILGDDRNAIEILEDANKLPGPIFLNRELDLWFIFDRLKGDPRFDALLE